MRDLVVAWGEWVGSSEVRHYELESKMSEDSTLWDWWGSNPLDWIPELRQRQLGIEVADPRLV